MGSKLKLSKSLSSYLHFSKHSRWSIPVQVGLSQTEKKIRKRTTQIYLFLFGLFFLNQNKVLKVITVYRSNNESRKLHFYTLIIFPFCLGFLKVFNDVILSTYHFIILTKIICPPSQLLITNFKGSVVTFVN